MKCDVNGILCSPDKCSHRNVCEIHRKDPYYYKEELLTSNEKQFISEQRMQISQKRSIGKNLDHWDIDPVEMNYAPNGH